MDYIRRKLTNRIHEIRTTKVLLHSKQEESPNCQYMQQVTTSADATLNVLPKKTRKAHANKLDNYFAHKAIDTPLPEINAIDIPDVATDVRSTYFHLHKKRYTYAENKNFHIVINALSELRGYVSRTRLRKITTDPPKTPKTIRQYFKERNFEAIRFNQSPSPTEPTGAQERKAARIIFHTSYKWQTYYVQLLVLRQARQWLSHTERLDHIADAPVTPKTNFQLADAIKNLKAAEYAPFGYDFEDAGGYSPVISRLLFYAEIHNCSDNSYGTFSAPNQMPHYTYKQLQEWIIEHRRLQQRSDGVESSPSELVQTAGDLAAKLRAFASDAIVVKHLIEFALPSKKRANAAEVTAKGAATAAQSRSTRQDNATEHTKASRSGDEKADDQREAIAATTDHTGSIGHIST